MFGGSGDTAYDSDGHMMRRINDNMAMDMDTSDIHFVFGWDDEDD